MNSFRALPLLAALALGLPLPAQAPCARLDAAACWHVINASSQGVTLSCGTFELDNVRLGAGEEHSRQLDPRYGDGLGYPQPNTFYTLSARYADGVEVTVPFATVGWGDRVQVRVEDAGVKVTLRDAWRDAEPKVFEVSR